MKNLSKFTNTDVRLEDLKGCRAYYLRNKINNKEKLTREEKDYITLNINSNAYFKDSIPYLGWRFYFGDVVKTYVYKHFGTWHERKAIDKTALRNCIYGKIDKILEVK